MIGLIQRVKNAAVNIDNKTHAQIDEGILLFLGVEKTDTVSHVKQLSRKIVNYRIFADEHGKMNKSLLDTAGQLLVVSQFTLVAQTDKGTRPGFSKGASPEHGLAMYEAFIQHTSEEYLACQSGVFGADMQISLVNDGPVTFLLNV